VKRENDRSEDFGIFSAHPETDESTAKVVAAAMELLVASDEGRSNVLATSEELG